MKTRKILSIILVVVTAVTMVTSGMPLSQMASAAGKTALSVRKMTLTIGSKRTLKLKNNKKKTIWKIIAGKKYIRFSNKAKNSVKIAGMKAGTAKIQVKAGKKKYTCIVHVKATSVNVPTQMTQNPVKPVYSILPDITENIPHQTQSCPTKSPLTEVSPSAEAVTSKPFDTFIPEYSPTVDASPKPMESSEPETEKDSGDVEKLKELIKVQKETGENHISNDINSSQYVWKDGRLDTILWDSLGIQGEMTLEGFDTLTHFGCNNNKLSHLQIKNCPQLEYIRCNQNQLTDLDVTEGQSLRRLKCSNNRLKTLNIDSNLKLEYVDASGNELVNLNVQNNTHLQCLFVSFNRLATLDIQNNEELMELECSNNQLMDIDVSQNLKLTNLGCGGNQLTRLDVEGLVCLKTLNCYGNQLKDLNVNQNINLEHLNCSSNQIAALYVDNNQQLTELYCESNGIEELNVDENYKLRVLYCGNNKIKELNIQNNSELWCLACDKNPISMIDITNNHKLELFSYGDSNVSVTVIGQNGREFTSAYVGWGTGSSDEDW